MLGVNFHLFFFFQSPTQQLTKQLELKNVITGMYAKILYYQDSGIEWSSRLNGIKSWILAIYWHLISYLCPRSTGGGGLLFYLRPSKIFFVAFFSSIIDGRNLIFGDKLHIGMPYCGKHFWTCQIPTSCLPT